MRDSVAAVFELVSSIDPVDDRESRDRAATLAWLRDTDDVFRRDKPATPPTHLVAYVVPTCPDTGDLLLVAHRNAGLWLPPGGHVEPGEHPATTARRELAEELGVAAMPSARPVFLTVTVTTGIDSGHTDVSLWFPVPLTRTTALRPDPGEFAEVRWWTRDEIAAAGSGSFDPEFGRYLARTDEFAARPS
jgi:8-oxo-dGTP diphosphatase